MLLAHIDLLLEAVACSTGDSTDVQRLDIIVEKHGSDYHPARLIAEMAGRQVSFVANVALTERGLFRLTHDFHWLNFLGHHFHQCFVPRVHFLTQPNENATDSGNPVLGLFVGEWLEGYHEFHLTTREQGEKQAIVLWNTETGHSVLSPEDAGELYTKAAFVLTYYYNVIDFVEVFPWHNAAGDFVARRNAEITDVRLVTVRQYGARVSFPDDDPENRVTACLAFLANLTIRMRLDRFDGTGEVAWADEQCVTATAQGFLQGLTEQVSEGRCDPDFFRSLLKALESMSLSDWAELFREVVDSYDPDAPDMPILRKHLVEHILEVSAVFG